MFEDSQSATQVLSALSYNTLSAIRGESGVAVNVAGSDASKLPFYVENITQQSEMLTITGYDRSEQDNYLEISIECSTDGTNWELLGITGSIPLTRALQPGEKVYLRATTNAWYEYQDEPYIDHGCSIFGVSKVGGNIMSLLYGSSFTGSETTFPSESMDNFNGLFTDKNDEDGFNRNLISASELILPAIILTEQCYTGMFISCTSLIHIPDLSATTLAPACYADMFYGCTSLTTAPTLPATTLAPACYASMFGECTSLTTAPELPATTLVQECYTHMFSGCTSLTTAPELHATNLVELCYALMFKGCTSLNYIKCLATDISGVGCLRNWVSDVSATGTFIKNSLMSGWPTGTSGIPTGWDVQDAA